jgi:hypothetical protein
LWKLRIFAGILLGFPAIGPGQAFPNDPTGKLSPTARLAPTARPTMPPGPAQRHRDPRRPHVAATPPVVVPIAPHRADNRIVHLTAPSRDRLTATGRLADAHARRGGFLAQAQISPRRHDRHTLDNRGRPDQPVKHLRHRAAPWNRTASSGRPPHPPGNPAVPIGILPDRGPASTPK